MITFVRFKCQLFLWLQFLTLQFLYFTCENGCRSSSRVYTISLKRSMIAFITYRSKAASINMFKVNNRNNRTRCEKWSTLTIKAPQQHQWRRSGVFIVNFEHISHLVSIVNFEQVNASWEITKHVQVIWIRGRNVATSNTIHSKITWVSLLRLIWDKVLRLKFIPRKVAGFNWRIGFHEEKMWVIQKLNWWYI